MYFASSSEVGAADGGRISGSWYAGGKTEISTHAAVGLVVWDCDFGAAATDMISHHPK